MTFTLTVEYDRVPANATFDAAQVISFCQGRLEGTTRGEPNNQVWYRWTAPWLGRVVFEVVTPPSVGFRHNLDLGLYRMTPGGTTTSDLILVDFFEDIANTEYLTSWVCHLIAEVEAGVEYWLTVGNGSAASGYRSPFTLSWKMPPRSHAPAGYRAEDGATYVVVNSSNGDNESPYLMAWDGANIETWAWLHEQRPRRANSTITDPLGVDDDGTVYTCVRETDRGDSIFRSYSLRRLDDTGVVPMTGEPIGGYEQTTWRDRAAGPVGPIRWHMGYLWLYDDSTSPTPTLHRMDKTGSILASYLLPASVMNWRPVAGEEGFVLTYRFGNIAIWRPTDPLGGGGELLVALPPFATFSAQDAHLLPNGRVLLYVADQRGGNHAEFGWFADIERFYLQLWQPGTGGSPGGQPYGTLLNEVMMLPAGHSFTEWYPRVEVEPGSSKWVWRADEYVGKSLTFTTQPNRSTTEPYTMNQVWRFDAESPQNPYVDTSDYDWLSRSWGYHGGASAAPPAAGAAQPMFQYRESVEGDWGENWEVLFVPADKVVNDYRRCQAIARATVSQVRLRKDRL